MHPSGGLRRRDRGGQAARRPFQAQGRLPTQDSPAHDATATNGAYGFHSILGVAHLSGGIQRSCGVVLRLSSTQVYSMRMRMPRN